MIRSAATEVEEAQKMIENYEQRGSQTFLTFPWAHMIGPFPEMRMSIPILNKTAEPGGADNSEQQRQPAASDL